MWRFAFGLLLFAFPGCREMLGSSSQFVEADAPTYREPSEHAPPLDVTAPLNGARSGAEGAPAIHSALLEHARAARAQRPKGTEPTAPATVDPVVADGEPPPIRRPEIEPEPLFAGPVGDEQDALPEAPATPEDEGATWLEEASGVSPGCILNGAVPGLPLPSPEAIAWLLGTQPRGFTGVAREAMVCLLAVGRATKAEVFGATAFRPSAIALRTALAGDERLLGVVAASVVTDEPRGSGTLVVALDEREDGWTVRDVVYLPWDGNEATHRVLGISEERVLSKKRSGLVVKQGDREAQAEHHVALTSQDIFLEIARFPVASRSAEGSVTATVVPSGKSFPKALSYRGIHHAGDVAGDGRFGTWVIERWATTGEAPYVLEAKDDGQISLESVARLLLDARAADAAWVYEAVPKAVRETAEALVLGARVEDARGRPRKAALFWKKVFKASDLVPEHHREYARWLASERKKKDAVKAFRKYLELVPEANDREQVEAEILELGGKPLP